MKMALFFCLESSTHRPFSISSLAAYPGVYSKYPLDSQKLYYLDFKTQSGVLDDILEVRNIQNDYIVNVYNLNDIEIFSVEGITIKGVTYHAEQEILEQYNDVFAGR